MSYRSSAPSKSPLAWLKKMSPINILLVAILGVGLILAVYVAKLSQENRQQASISGGTAILSIDAPAQVTPGTQVSIPLKINTGLSQVIGVQAFLNMTGTLPADLTFTPATISNLTTAVNSLSDINGGKKLTLGILTSNPSVNYSTQNTQVTLGTFSFTAPATGKLDFIFDPVTTKIVQASTNTDILKTPDTASVTFLAVQASASPTSSPENRASPSPSPSPSPTPSPSPSPSPTPTANPASPTPTPATGGTSLKSCNQSCSSNSECNTNLRCYNGACRLAANPESSSCSNPTDQGIHRSCDQYCADTNECASGYTCFYNKCRLPSNPDSSSCSAATATTYQQIALSCRQRCSSNTQCATNLRCYQGECRLATNPTSTTCSAPVIYYNPGTTTGPEKGTQLPADYASPVVYSSVAPSPSSTSNPFPTPKPVTVQPKKSALAELLQSLKDRGLPLQTLLLIAGLVIFLIVIVILFLNYQREMNANSSSSPLTTVATTTPVSPYTQSLEEKINALRTQSASQSNLGVTPEQPVVTPATPSPVPPTSSTSSSMMDRLAQRGVTPPQAPSVPPSEPPKF
jgi:hypothetical protein